MSRNAKLAAAIAAGSLLASGTGYLASVALSQGGPGEATRTVTVNVATGPRGPEGPPGPPGPSGAFTCNPGFSYGQVIFNAPGGQQTIQTCLKDQ